MIKENEVVIETADNKLFLKLVDGKRPHAVLKDKAKHTYLRVDHPAVNYVESESVKDKLYMVISHPNGWICTCKSWRFHGECKHILLVKSKLDVA